MVGTSTGYKRGYNIPTTGMKECLEIGTASGKILRCTEDHIVCVRPGSGYKWVRADELSLGDDDQAVPILKSLVIFSKKILFLPFPLRIRSTAKKNKFPFRKTMQSKSNSSKFPPEK